MLRERFKVNLCFIRFNKKTCIFIPGLTCFIDDLKHTKTWIVIGYSFNDEFILNMFVESLVLDRDHKLILVTPNPNGVVKRFSPDNVTKVFSSRTKKDVDFRGNIVLVKKEFGGPNFKEVNEEIIGKLS